MTTAEVEVEKLQMLEERIKAPSIWGRVPCGIRFEDLQEKRYEDAVRLLKKHYITDEITYRSVKLAEDKEGTDEFIHNVRIWMKDKMSIAIVKEATDKLVGVLVMRINEKAAFSRTFSRVKLQYNPLYASVMKFYNKIEEPVDLYEKLGVKRYLKVYILALKSRYRHRNLGLQVLLSAMNLAASAFIAGMAGIFTSGRSQALAEHLGFEKYNEIYYVRYLVDDQIVFWDTGVGNYGAALMGYRLPNVEEPQELVAQMSSRFHIKTTNEEEIEEVEPEKEQPKDSS